MKFIATELPFAFLTFGSLYLGILGFKSGQLLARWISAYLIYGDQALCLFSLFASFKYCLESYSATTEPLRKELSGH